MVCRNLSAFADAPRAGSAEAKETIAHVCQQLNGCTPCRQRRGKERCSRQPLAAQPDAPRAGSAEAKLSVQSRICKRPSMHPVQAVLRQRAIVSPPFAPVTDAPRAGSAKQNNNVPPDGPLTTGRHFFTFHPSRIPTAFPHSPSLCTIQSPSF